MKNPGLCGKRLSCAALLLLGMAAQIELASARDGAKPQRVGESEISFAARPAGDAWSDYHAIVWQAQEVGNCRALRELGIDAGAIIAEDRDNPAEGFEKRVAPLLDCGLGWYVENIATDFYSAYHRWSPGRPVNWRFVEARKAYRENPQDLGAFMREPSLSDPGWQRKIRDRLTETVRVHRAYRPLFYDLGDETGIAGLSAFWDFDFSPHSLGEMRRWLKQRYRSLAALNRQWGSRFADWDAVTPMTTAEAMQRADANFSAWADFKEWMDAEFARALRRGTVAIHAADPAAHAAIAGGQIPGWGGYDYSRLATAVDLMELYDGGGNVEIVRSLNPNLVLLTTSFSSGAVEAHGIWRALLRGSRGVIFWDPKHEIVGEDGRIGGRGRDASAHVREIKAGLGALLIHSRRQVAPVAILYSPASMRTQWMLDWQPKGNAWSERDTNSTYEDESAVRSSMTGFLDVLGRVGLEARVVVPELIEKGALRRGIRVLILPRVMALSESEAAEIRRFVADGGTVIADGKPGQFDQHSRRLQKPLLSDLFQTPTDRSGSRFRLGKGRAISFDAQAGSDPASGEASRRDRSHALVQMLAEAGVEPMFTLARKDGSRAMDVETHIWQNGDTTIVALQREPGAATAEPVLLTLREPARFYDLRARNLRGTTQSLELTIDPVTPTLLAVSTSPRRTPAISGPRRVFAGGTATMTFSLSRAASPGTAVLQVDVVDPKGDAVPYYSENVLLRGARVAKRFDFAFADIAGKWQIRAIDVLTGNSAARELEVVGR